MTSDRYVEWLGRARAHQAEHRLIDALLCYRRALRETPRGSDAQFHIGEIEWRLARRPEAIAAWRAACEANPRHMASWQALADALAVTGDFAASAVAVERILTLRPNNARAKAMRAVLGDRIGDLSDAELAQAVRARAGWPLSLLARAVEEVVGHGGSTSFPQASAALLDAASAAAIGPGDERWLRRIGLALAQARDAVNAASFADRYADACRGAYRRSMPLLWPVRSAGKAARLGVLVSHERQTPDDALRSALSSAGLRENVRLFVFVDRPTDADSGPQSAEMRVLPGAPDAAARAIASLDLDVLLDMTGGRADTGPLLALHPARRTWLVEEPDGLRLRGLADRSFPREAAETVPSSFTSALRELCEALAAEPVSEWDCEELSRRWEDAVRSHQRGELDAARAGYASVLDAQPAHAPALYLAGVLARTGGDAAASREWFRSALAAAPDYADARVAFADSLVAAGDPDAAAAVAREGIAVAPDSQRLWRALGQAGLKRGDATAAALAFEEALRRDPTDAETHYNHGVALQTARKPADAARAYQRALAFQPDLHAADFNLGVIFDQQRNVPAAIAAFSNVLQRVPDHAGAYKALAETLLASGRIDAWFANFERFERHCSGHLALAVHALEVCAYRADFARLERYLDGLRQGAFRSEQPDETLDALQQLLYLLHFFDVEPELIGRYARTHDALARTLYGEPAPRRARRTPGRLRVGYLSPDFRNHVMGKMMWEPLRRHDHARFETIGYATGDERDEWTARYEKAFTRFHSLGALTDRAAAQRIADDDLDLLIDLATHTKGARPGILALKPARVQITHVASAGTLAMSAIDFKLTDRYADAPEEPAWQIETLLAMDGCVYPFRHIDASAATFAREALHIARDAVVIGAFCTPLKLSQRCLALWRDVLSRVPRALLAFSPVHPALRSVYQRIAAAVGIEARRLVFVPQGRDDAENQARYRLVDFVLDPMPYGGVNGTLEALDMGVPVVTLVGRRHAERTSYSILSNLGVNETIAQTGGEYVAIAERLATDAGFMRVVRECIAAGIRHSPLTDMDAHTRNLEAAYVRALEARAPEALAGAAA